METMTEAEVQELIDKLNASNAEAKEILAKIDKATAKRKKNR